MKEIKSSRCLNSAQYYKRLHAGVSATGGNIHDSVRISEEGKKKLITGHIMAGLMEMVTLKGRKPRS